MFLSNMLVSETPTIFELSMSAGLSHGLKPAFEYLLNSLSENTASTTVFNATVWKDELYTTLILLLERYYLSTYEGTFADNFYGLKRERFVNNQQQPMRPQDKASTLFLVALLPYFTDKLVKFHAKITQENASFLQQHDEIENRNSALRLDTFLTLAFAKGFPYARALLDSYLLGFQLLFMFNKTRYYSPLLWMQGIIISRLTADDYRNFSTAEELSHKTSTFLSRMSSKFLRFLRTMLIASALGFKLLEWYYSPENISQRESNNGANAGHNAVPTPLPPRPSPRGVDVPPNPMLCPLCHEVRKNPAVASSGFAFCFSCIQQYVSEHNECPVTCIPCNVKQIRRIYQA
uniref:Peroxisome assembly protein 12 n=1 Tax=Aplanochytrium stocchinoi TaxID=215587 RepID=A0A6S8DRG3_9STRA|mmetsp:Transcript_4742/g.5505  ORF Transcript_4742/g.5505 Transcript_4742/m.5505 type:complete len:348 (+) Transcript_4742:663-1706(+)